MAAKEWTMDRARVYLAGTNLVDGSSLPEIYTLYVRYVRDAFNRNMTFGIPLSFFSQLVKEPCTYCGREPYKAQSFTRNVLVNGLDRLDNSQGYTLENITPCCSACNTLKGTMDSTTFIELCQKIVEHWGTL